MDTRPPVERDVCAVLGHELRNPLAAAVTDVTVAAEMTDPDDPRAVFLRRALADLDRAARLLTACLEWGRGADPRLRAVSVATLAADLRARFVDPRVRVGAVDAALELEADPVLLGRVLDNLVQNALAVGADEVLVRFEGGADRLSIVVDDDGPGLGADIAGRAFEPFVSGRGSSGLGLAIVRDVVTAHGGTVRAERSGPAGGARFVVELPVREVAAWTS